MFEFNKDNERPKPEATDKPKAASDSKSLQRNQAWDSLALGATRIQPKLKVSAPQDPQEQEADRIAQSVVGTGDSTLVDATEIRASSPALQRMCDDCKEDEEEEKGPGLQRKATADASTGKSAPPIVHDVLNSAGRPLDAGTRSSVEPRFGADFSDVRVHADGRAADSAAAVGARAYTVDRNIVFGAGEYAPDTSGGRQLLSHELAHVVQQRRGAARAVQRQADFGEMYKYKGSDGKVRSHGQKEYETYKPSLGKTQFSSDAGGHKFPSMFPLRRDELLEIFSNTAKARRQKVYNPSAAVIDPYVEELNQAFRVFKIDTVETQASFIANAYHESDQFRYMTETSKFMSGNKPYEQDPTKVKVDESWLNQAATGTVTDPDGSTRQVTGYGLGKSIRPQDPDWQKSFIGRGPVQVTHVHNYVQALAVMENRADELKKLAEDFAKKREAEGSKNPQEITPRQSNDEIELREAIAKIKADPREAANPKYAFMFSAGFMKAPDDLGKRGDVKALTESPTAWMGTQPADAKANKTVAYAEAIKVLMKKWDADTKEEAAMYP